MRLTDQVHQLLKQTLQAGDIVIDATTGNGHDALFLCQCVGKNGKLFAFDVQPKALQSAQAHLQKHNIQTPITWIHAGHEHMLEHIPQTLHHQINAITFNLGYLPHSDKHITTKTNTTLTALKAAALLLKKQGTLSILAYTAHQGGREECEAIKTWAHTLTHHFSVSIHIPTNTKLSPPEWINISKL